MKNVKSKHEYPIDEGCTQVILRDDDDNLEVVKLAEICGREGILDPNKASVNITESEDVIVGPVTQFYAPVTIYQNINGEINGTEKNEVDKKLSEPITESPLSIVNEDTPKLINKGFNISKKNLRKSIAGKNCKIAYIFIFAFIISLGVGLTFYTNSKPPEENNSTNPTVSPLSNTTSKNEPKGEYIQRDVWGAWYPINGVNALAHPVPLVVIKHTAGRFSSEYLNCRLLIKDIQSYHQNDKHMTDISYNFLVCGDENIYVGRGWEIQNAQRHDSIDIAFVGDFDHMHLTSGMVKSAQKLISDGIVDRKISQDYKLVAHSQTAPQSSPGKYALEEIKKWPHYYSGKLY
ncbi:unnamed protein product [Brassicogethes aeneus]|uniref:Uncharacterized protein n=1 Tax=Brassicogethes aeneus TaxID=1431903 RepID=A0A9P0B0E1_BRAAE|nr:unnamed protein product [Brassicogethes aeneus]